MTVGITEPLLQCCCLDSSFALKPIIEKYKSVIITSGTLSPLDVYGKLLNIHPIVCMSFPMSTFRYEYILCCLCVCKYLLSLDRVYSLLS